MLFRSPPIVAQLDGDVFQSTSDVRIDVIPRALRLVVPRDHADNG